MRFFIQYLEKNHEIILSLRGELLVSSTDYLKQSLDFYANFFETMRFQRNRN